MAGDQAKLTAISGVGGKGPACFLVEAEGKRLLLDLGYGPQPGLIPNVDGVGTVDAVLLTHGHKDHAGSLSLRSKIGNPPVYATETVARHLPSEIQARLLPLRGTAEVLGLRLETGRNGHAPGGVWFRLSIGDGLLYTGDYSTESILYAFDQPPPAATVVFDASYGDADIAFADGAKAFDDLMSAKAVLMPVPANGRGPEIALYLARNGCTRLRVDQAMRAGLEELANAASVSVNSGVAAEISKLLGTIQDIGDTQDGIVLTTPADGAGGETARALERWEGRTDTTIVFTGYLPSGTPAERLVKSGRATYRRWNVHPRLSENTTLIRSVRARTAIPAFCDPQYEAALAKALAPAEVTFATSADL